jgi:hypothetical protein
MRYDTKDQLKQAIEKRFGLELIEFHSEGHQTGYGHKGKSCCELVSPNRMVLLELELFAPDENGWQVGMVANSHGPSNLNTMLQVPTYAKL